MTEQIPSALSSGRERADWIHERMLLKVDAGGTKARP
jgi:hypothetical protein